MRLPSSPRRPRPVRPAALLVVTTLTTLALTARGARADERVQCAEAAEEGQTRRDQADLLAARELFVFCARAPCSTSVQRSCAGWLEDVEARLPSLVVTLSDGEGRDVIGARLLVDGKERAGPLDGTSITVNPGVRELVAIAPGGARTSVKLVVREGEKARHVALRAERPRTAPALAGSAGGEAARPRGNGAPWWPAVALGGVSIAGFVTFLALDANAHAEYRDYETSCSPTCSDDKLASLRTKVTLSNVGLGVGIGAAVLAIGWTVLHFATRPSPAASVMLRDGTIRF